MLKKLRSTFYMLLLVNILFSGLFSVQALAITPRYAGISNFKSTLTISNSGNAVCSGKAIAWNGYTVELTVELKRDGTTIKTWTDSGTGSLDAGGTYYITSGHSYVVTTTAEVRNSKGSLVETPSTDSSTVFY